MVVVLDTVSGPARPRHPEKAHRPDAAGAAQARLDPRQGAGLGRLWRDAAHRAREQSAHGVRGGGLPEYRRVLGEEARHLHDHGRHLHAGLRLLQRQDRAARAARSARAGTRRRGGREARPRACRRHLGRPRRSRRRRRRAFRPGDPRHPRALPGDHDRGADAGFPAQGRRRRDGGGGAGRTCSTTISKRCRRNISRCGRARAISTPSGCCSR